MGLKACQKYYVELTRLARNDTTDFNANKVLQIYLENSKGKAICGKGWTDMFYIPGKFAKNYVKLSDIAYKSKLLSEIAVHNIMGTLDKIENIELLNGTYLPSIGIFDLSARSFWKTYELNMTVIHPVKFNTHERELTISIFRKWLINYKYTLTNC